jgi:hypothetical protein
VRGFFSGAIGQSIYLNSNYSTCFALGSNIKMDTGGGSGCVAIGVNHEITGASTPYVTLLGHMAHGHRGYETTIGMYHTQEVRQALQRGTGDGTQSTAFNLVTYDSALADASIRNEATTLFVADVAVFTTDGATQAWFRVEGVISKTAAGVARFVGTPTTTRLFNDAGAATWTVAASIVSNALRLQVNPQGTTVKAKGSIRRSEVRWVNPTWTVPTW